MGAIHRPDHLMSLPSCGCIRCPARIRPNCGKCAGNNPKRADTAGGNGGARSSRATCSAVFPVDPPTGNNTSNQPRRNIAAGPTRL